MFFFFFSSRRRHTRSLRDWSSDVCSSDLGRRPTVAAAGTTRGRCSPRWRSPTSSSSSSPCPRTPASLRSVAMGLDTLAARLRPVLGDKGVITDRQQLRTYECDGLAHYKVTPGLVVLPETTDQVAAVVRACAEAGVPFVARGSGTGLSGGALPHADGVLLVTARMRRILEVDVES